MTQTYKTGGVGRKTNRVKLVQVLTRQKTGEIIPEIIRPYAATMIQRHSRRHQNWLEYGRKIGNFFNNLIRFKNVASNPLNISLERQNEIKDNLMQSIPLGRTLERFLNKPGLAHNITELKTTLNNDFTFPQRNTGEHNQLMSLLNETRVMIGNEVYARVNIPPIPERATRARLDMGEGNRNKSRRKGKSKGKSKRRK